MNHLLKHLMLLMILMTLAACGGGGGGGDTNPNPTPSTTTYLLTFSAASNGTISGTASQTINSGGSSTTVTALPTVGYHFVNWTENGSVASTNTALTVTNVSSNQTYIANFAADSVVKTTATLKINLTGTLPASTSIAGADFTLILPTNVTPALTNGSVATTVVTPSGLFAGSSITPQIVYTAATLSTLGTLHITVANSVNSGVTQIGEVATIVLQLSNGALPTLSNFTLTATSATDATYYSVITGISASIASVTLQ